MEEGNKQKKSGGIARRFLYILIVLLIAGCFSQISVIACNDSLGLGINITAILLMTFIIIAGLGVPLKNKGIGIFALEHAISDLRFAKTVIDQVAEDPNLILMDQLENEDLFDEEHLKTSFQAFLVEMNHLYHEKRSFRHCDIQDFINDDLLDHIVNNSLNDLVGGAMTGLGILGTFIGLTIGLANFKNGNATELMESIKPLMDGIKIAFLTSIYGMIYSLVFNFFYKSRVRNAQKVLDEFLDSYYRIESRPENEGFTKLIELQSEQNDNVAQFAESISIAFAQRLEESLLPSMRGIQDTIGKFADSVAESQNEKMGEIAEGFISHLDQAMGNQLTHLGESIGKLCEWQETMFERMQIVAEEVLTSGDKLKHVNEEIQQSINVLGDFVTDLKQAQMETNTSFAKLMEDSRELIQLANNQSSLSNNLLQKGETALQSITQIEDVMNDKTKLLHEEISHHLTHLDEYLETRKETLTLEQKDLSDHLIAETNRLTDTLQKQEKQLQDTLDQQSKSFVDLVQQDTAQIEALQVGLKSLMDSMSEEMRSSTRGLNEASKELTNNLDGAMERTFKQIDEQLGQIVMHFSGTINEMREVTEKIPKVYLESSNKIKKQTTDYLEQISTANVNMERMVRKLYDKTTLDQ